MRANVFVIALLLTSAPASGADLIFSAYLGGNFVEDGPFELGIPAAQTDLRLESAQWEGRPFERPLYWGVRGGWVMGRLGQLELVPELEFIHAKIHLKTETITLASGTHEGASISGEDVRVGEVIESFNMSHGLNFLLLNLALRRGFWPSRGRPQGRLQLVGRAGGGVSLPHFESTLARFGHHEEYEFGGGAFHGSVGLEAPVWGPLGALFEYKYTTTSPRGALAQGEAKAEADMHHLVFGISARF